MRQKFFSDTLTGRFIKRLLKASALPIHKRVTDGDFLVKGQLYTYREFIISCEESGQLLLDTKEHLFPGETLFPSMYLFPRVPAIKIRTRSTTSNEYEIVEKLDSVARFKVIDYYNPENAWMTYNYHSKYMYYDSATHYQLGEYLRDLKAATGLNLMHYYNCFNNAAIINLYLEDGKCIIGNNPRYKQLAVPVKFGRTYTIALESYTKVQMQTVVYNPATGLVTRYDPTSSEESSYYNFNDYEAYASLRFESPILKTIYPTDLPDLQTQERNLYLIIQVEKSNNSSVVVLEGDYVHQDNGCLNPELLAYNYRQTFAFSDRLIEYLLDGVVTNFEMLDGNINYTQSLIHETFKYYRTQLSEPGCVIDSIWQPSITKDIKAIEQQMLSNQQYFDLDGNMNVDVERFMIKAKEGNN